MRVGLKLRGKVLLLSSVLLVIPYAGYQYVREMESFLQDGLEDSVMGAARALAGALHDRPALFARSISPRAGQSPEYGAAADIAVTDIYVHPLRAPVLLDGYADDWLSYAHSAYEYSRPGDRSDAATTLSATHLVGKHEGYLYALLRVTDERIVYRSPYAARLPDGDHLRLLIEGDDGVLRHYLLSTISPGWMDVHAPSKDTIGPFFSEAASNWRQEIRIRGEWRETDDGYVVELRIPLWMTGPRLGFAVGDVDDAGTRQVERTAATFNIDSLRNLGALILPSAEIENVIRSLGRTPGRRIRVVDQHRRVLARGGSLRRPAHPLPINPLYALLLTPPGGEAFQDEAAVAQLSGPEVESALAGTPEAQWRKTGAEDTFIVSAAHPIWVEDGIVGAVVIEETSLAIQTVRRQALAQLFNITLAVCLGGGLSLLLFASRISVRLRRLRNEAEAAIDVHGRVTGSLSGSSAVDEIGDVSRSFSAMMERLRQYNRYLETLAGRLSHELRTPIAIVRSSLDNVAMISDPEEAEIYRRRARDGLARLDAIINRMSEAARLEQTLGNAEPEVVELSGLISAAVDAYRETWPDRRFRYQGPDSLIHIRGVPDLIVQMLDKLISNAVEFGVDNKPIEIHVLADGLQALLHVISFGAQLPQTMRDTLFESMVSIRPPKKNQGPHLGLGLYIARLIVEFHNGEVRAENLADEMGVCVSVRLPIWDQPVGAG